MTNTDFREVDPQSTLSLADQKALLEPWPELTEVQRRIQRGRVAVLGTVEQTLGNEGAREVYAALGSSSSGNASRIGRLPRF